MSREARRAMMPGGPFSLRKEALLAMTRNRRTLIAILAFLGVLCVLGLTQTTGRRGFFDSLARMKLAQSPARLVFTALGRQLEFDVRLSKARARKVLDRENMEVPPHLLD